MRAQETSPSTSGIESIKLELRSVTKEYDELTAVDDLDLQIEEGELICFLGPSGSGKTTTLNMIAGLEQPTAGDVILDGKKVNEKSARDRDIGLVFQNLALFDRMTVEENIGFSARVGSATKQEQREQIERFASIVGVEDILDQNVTDLSSSDRQRVALGRSLAAQPSLLLLDEPMDNLDAEEAIDMRGELKKLQEELNQTMVYVTHDQEEAMSLADRIIVLHQGKLMQVGTPRELYDEPANRFVADFIGSPSMNFFTGTIQNDQLEIFDTSIPLTALESALPDLDTDQFSESMTVAIRPESMAYGHGSVDIQFNASVQEYEPLGSETVIFCEISDQEFAVVTEKRPKLDRGMSCPVELSLDDLYVVDEESKEMIHK